MSKITEELRDKINNLLNVALKEKDKYDIDTYHKLHGLSDEDMLNSYIDDIILRETDDEEKALEEFKKLSSDDLFDVDYYEYDETSWNALHTAMVFNPSIAICMMDHDVNLFNYSYDCEGGYLRPLNRLASIIYELFEQDDSTGEFKLTKYNKENPDEKKKLFKLMRIMLDKLEEIN